MSDDEQMETAGTSGIQTGIKRKQPDTITIDPDTHQEISTSKKARIEPNKPRKVQVLKFILLSYENICKELNLVPAEMNNITTSSQITSAIFTTFMILRQRQTGTTCAAEVKTEAVGGHKIHSKGKEFVLKKVEAKAELVKAAVSAQLEFKRYMPGDQENWYGTAAPYLDFFAAFQLRMKELRLGHGSMPINKENGKTKVIPTSKYGLSGTHHILLEGCTFPPERRSAMAQSVGPMTAMLLHIRTEEKYRRKGTDAAKRALAHIPFIDDVLEVVKGKNASEISGLLSIIADIAYITTSRQAQRMFFPLCFLYRAWRLDVDSRGFIKDAEKKPTSFVGGDTILEVFNVSGHGGYYLYKLCCMMNWEFDCSFSQLQASQAVFHCIFGTYKEDLTILKQVTKLGRWDRREDFGKGFKKIECATNGIQLDLPKFKLVSKLCSSNQTGLLATSYIQAHIAPVFSGRRTQHVSDDFFEQVAKKVRGLTSGKTIPQLTSTLSQTLDVLMEAVNNNGKTIKIGTTDWSEMDSLDHKGYGAVSKETIVGFKRYFLGPMKV